MKGMIFAAGLGARLRPLTDNCPKALVSVGGIPMLERVIKKMIAAGITEIVVNVHHFAEKIKAFLKDNDDFGILIHVSDESDLLLDTGGGILNAKKWLIGDEPFVVHNADILTDFNLEEMISAHQKNNADVTLLVDKRVTSRYLLFDSGKMVGWKNEKTGDIRSPWNLADRVDVVPLAFGGVHVISPNVFGFLEISPEKVFSITPFYISYCDRLNIQGFTPEGPYNWVDIGRLDSLERAESIVSAH